MRVTRFYSSGLITDGLTRHIGYCNQTILVGAAQMIYPSGMSAEPGGAPVAIRIEETSAKDIQVLLPCGTSIRIPRTCIYCATGSVILPNGRSVYAPVTRPIIAFRQSAQNWLSDNLNVVGMQQSAPAAIAEDLKTDWAQRPLDCREQEIKLGTARLSFNGAVTWERPGLPIKIEILAVRPKAIQFRLPGGHMMWLPRKALFPSGVLNNLNVTCEAHHWLDDSQWKLLADAWLKNAPTYEETRQSQAQEVRLAA